MPSAIRLAGLVIFALMAWVVSEQIAAVLPEGATDSTFPKFNALLGGVLGWVFMNPRVAERASGPIGAGITAVVAILIWGLMLHSIREMIKLALRKHYDGPVEAVIGVFQLMIDYGFQIATPTIIITVLLFGIVGGLICSGVAKRWN